MIALHRGTAQAVIDPNHGFACTRLRIGRWEVLGQRGAHTTFPWTGDLAARTARLQVGSTALDFGGGPPGGLASGAWSLQSVDENAEGPSVHASFRTDAAPDIYPYDIRLGATWRLNDEGLRLELQLINPGRRHAPFGVGVRVHLARVADSVRLLAPAEEWWDAEAPVAVGTRGGPDLRRPVAIGKHVESRFTRRHFANLLTQVAVLAPHAGREVWLTTSSDFRELEVALDPNGVGSLESATCTPDAFALHAAGVPTGLRVLAPGESWRGSALLVALSRRIG